VLYPSKAVPTQALVIGAGLGGLAVALRLRARGVAVTVAERLDGPGGRAYEFVRDGHRYDAGPTVLTAPVLFEELFALFGERLADHVDLMPVAPWYRMQFNDGSVFNYGGSTEQIQAEIARFNTKDAARYPAYLDWSKKLFDKGYTELGDQAFLGKLSMLAALPAMLRLRADRSVYALTAKYFQDERIRRAFSIQPLLVGGDPFNTTSIYSLIHYLERKWGVWFPRGGMAALVRALVALGQRHGVEFLWNHTVSKVLQNPSGKVRGVAFVDGAQLAADTVVANADPGFVLSQLLDGPAREPLNVQRRKYSMSLFVWYFSTSKIYNEVAHHTILFGKTYREVLQKIFYQKVVPDDLSIYLHRPGATDPSYPAPGCDSFYALVPVPNLGAHIDWALEGPKLKALLQKELEARVLPGLGAAIVNEHCVAPDYFEQQLLSPQGAGFSLQPTLMQSAGFRFPNQSPQVAGLYFVGAGTHPGAGVPGVVTSAKVVERLMFGAVQ
jgi:phytoene desaturase